MTSFVKILKKSNEKGGYIFEKSSAADDIFI
jgi:hypothetical protein